MKLFHLWQEFKMVNKKKIIWLHNRLGTYICVYVQVRVISFGYQFFWILKIYSIWYYKSLGASRVGSPKSGFSLET